jgi:alpha-tubulin suppressor-like RCC1 family protein
VGDGTTTGRAAPVRVGTATDWTTVAPGGYHTLGIRADGSLWAWGENVYGQLGDGTTTGRTTPVRVGALTGWALITGGLSHSIALRKS